MRVSSVLAAVIGEQCDDNIVRLACELLNSSRGKLHILYVIEVERGFPIDAEIVPATAKGEEVLKDAEEVAKSYKIKSEGELVQARQVGSAVVQEAFNKNVDTIVIGSPYTVRYGSFSLGETVPYVLKNAPCQVIVWRDPVSQTFGNRDRAGLEAALRP